MNSGTAIAIVPARFNSTRLPGKPLIEIAGKPLIEHVYRRVAQARLIGRIVVATDDERIYRAVESFGGTARMTRRDHPSGTDRVAEAVSDLPPETLVVNVQGDEPLIEPEAIDRAVEAAQRASADVVTLMSRFANPAMADDPNRVKVVVGRDGAALYFSRSRIPSSGQCFLHIGLYAYRVQFLRRFVRLERTPLEMVERLEQLRALEHGFRIEVVEVPAGPSGAWGIDTPADLEEFRRIVSGAV
ncbi:MAG TPA: 3-deoxy-manno-octulosonate cytidylyltransferase [Terriglobia bacterium]|nr:3-deoxy-manno-octulosonate cytidylyltransferase [Terriglobia bacterium]